jgi:hypothetical protein
VKVRYDEGVATRIDPGAASAGDRMGQPSSRERLQVPGADAVVPAEGNAGPDSSRPSAGPVGRATGGELVERRAGAEGNAEQQRMYRAQDRKSVAQGLDRIRQAARQRKEETFTSLYHRLSVAMLRTAFFALKRDAAPGVDGLLARQLGCPVSDSKNVRSLRKGTMTQATLRNKGCAAGASRGRRCDELFLGVALAVAGGALLLTVGGSALSVALDGHFQDDGVVNQTVDCGKGHGGIREDAAPLAEGPVGGDQQAAAFVSGSHQLEQHAGFSLITMDVAEIVKNDQMILVDEGVTECSREMRFAGSAWPEQQDVGALVQPAIAAGEWMPLQPGRAAACRSWPSMAD